MKAIEFPSSLSADQTLSVPERVANQIPQGQPLRVLVLIADGDEDRDWELLAATQFAQGYAQSDAIYDQLPTG